MKEKIFEYLDKHGAMLLRGQALIGIKDEFNINKRESIEIYEEWRRNYIKIK